MYFNHYTIIKYVSCWLIHYVIDLTDLDVTSSSKVFDEFCFYIYIKSITSFNQ